MDFFRNRGITLKLVLSILVLSSIIFCVIFGYNYLFSRRIIIKQAKENAKNLALATINRIDRTLYSMEKVPESVADFLENTEYSEKDLMDILRSVVEDNPEIYGSTIAFEPHAFIKEHRHFAPYYYKVNGKIRFKYLDAKAYNYFLWDWYRLPKETGSPLWTEPYYDKGGGDIIMATYSVPFYKDVSGKKKFMGIVTADVSLSWLQEIVSSIKILKTGYAFLISKKGVYVTHPMEKLIMKENIFSVAKARGDDFMTDIGRKMIKGESGFIQVKNVTTGKMSLMEYAPLTANGWALGVLFPLDELMSDLQQLNQIVFILGVAGLVLLLLVIALIAASITKPLRLLAGATEDMAHGNLDVELPPARSKDEVGKLTESFAYMKTSLKQYIKELTETMAAKERMESELRIAHDIQMDMLPKKFPPFPERSDFDIYATMQPAKEVGGDLYNFFLLDDSHLCFTIGDVSGKGIPAALFMAVTQTLIKAKAMASLSPEEILNKVNRQLSRDNPSLMFVTLFLGILNIRTGELVYGNGGHNPPFIMRSHGAIEPLEGTNGMALGVMETQSFQAKKIRLQKGDSLFLYTDGVTEAVNDKEELFSEERLKNELKTLKGKTIKDVDSGIMDRVFAFSQGMRQADDITMLILRYYG